MLSFILNSVMTMQNTAEHKVTKFAYAFDENPQQYSEKIRKIGSLTERKFACPWCVQEALEFYTGRKFEKVNMPLGVFMKFNKSDYTEFSEEQLQFSGDILNMLIY